MVGYLSGHSLQVVKYRNVLIPSNSVCFNSHVLGNIHKLHCQKKDKFTHLAVNILKILTVIRAKLNCSKSCVCHGYFHLILVRQNKWPSGHKNGTTTFMRCGNMVLCSFNLFHTTHVNTQLKKRMIFFEKAFFSVQNWKKTPCGIINMSTSGRR